jgi:hypothetical protein
MKGNTYVVSSRHRLWAACARRSIAGVATVLAISIMVVNLGCEGGGGPSGGSVGSVAESNPNCHVICALSENRPVVHARRTGPAPSGVWSGWSFFGAGAPPSLRAIVDVDEATSSAATVPSGNEVHLVFLVGAGQFAPANSGDLVHVRQRADGNWSAFRAIEPGFSTSAVRPHDFVRVSIASVGGELLVCGVEKNGSLLHTIRHNNVTGEEFEGSLWAEWVDVEGQAGERGRFVDVGCASVTSTVTGLEELHLCGVTDDGRLWHAVRDQSGSWSSFGDVEGVAGERGSFVKVDCAGNSTRLHLVGVTDDGSAWYTIRSPTAWHAFENVKANAVAPGFSFLGKIIDVGIGFCNAGTEPEAGRDVSQLNIVALVPTTVTNPSVAVDGFNLYHTIWSGKEISWTAFDSPTHWMPFADFQKLIGWTTDPGNFVAVSVASRPFLPGAGP